MAKFPDSNLIQAPSVQESLIDFGTPVATADGEFYSWYLARKVRDRVDEAWSVLLGDRIGPYAVLGSAKVRLSDIEIVELLDSAYAFVAARVCSKFVPELVRGFTPPVLPAGFLWLIGVYVNNIPATGIHPDEYDDTKSRLLEARSPMPIYILHDGELRVYADGLENPPETKAYCVVAPEWYNFTTSIMYERVKLGGIVPLPIGTTEYVAVMSEADIPCDAESLLNAYVIIGGNESYIADLYQTSGSTIRLRLDPDPDLVHDSVSDARIYVPAIGRGSNSNTGRSVENAIVWRATQLYFTAVNKFDDAFSARRNMWNSLAPIMRPEVVIPKTEEENAA